MPDAVDYFLKIDGVPGESEKTGHKDEIEIESWSWGETNSGSSATGGGAGTGKVTMQDFSFAMTINKASPKLFLSCATGKHIKEALLTCREAGGKQQEYLKIKFADLLISSYQTGGSGTAVKPVEQITFNFTKIELSYAPQKKDGSLGPYVTHWYNLKETTSA
jgi:type VI secretion system secreted protein Hcp